MRSFKLLLVLVLAAFTHCAIAQPYYFPPTDGSHTWATLDPASLGWCPERIDSLYAFLDQHNSKAFIVLKDGKIVLEHYTGTFTQDSLWYWASAGKTLTSTMVGIAQEDGYLDINQPTSNYLGTGWTTESPAQEQLITVRNQLTMTTGLDDGVADPDCSTPACLSYKADAGSRWAYHNAPYTLLQNVVANATGQAFNTYFNNKLRDPIGMDGLWMAMQESHIYVSTARGMARYGLLALNRMVWGQDTILHDAAYIQAATTPSQTLNRSYGYLWWLNGQPSYMLPQTQLVFPGPLMPDAPADMYCGLGKNNQLLNVVPSQGLVLVRLGNVANQSGPSVSTILDNQIWQYMNQLPCEAGMMGPEDSGNLRLAPNPCKEQLSFSIPGGLRGATVTIRDMLGRPVASLAGSLTLDTSALPPGIYTASLPGPQGTIVSRFVKE